MSREKRLFSDKELIAGIRSGGVLKGRCMNFLMDHWEFLIPKMCKHHAIREEDAEELYLDATFVLYEHIVSGQFRGESSIATYLYRVYFNKCIDFMRKNTLDTGTKLEQIQNMEDASESILQKLMLRDELDKAMAVLNRLGNFCKELLLDALYWDYSPKEILKRHKLKSLAQVSSRKYKCLKKLKGLSEASGGETS